MALGVGTLLFEVAMPLGLFHQFGGWQRPLVIVDEHWKFYGTL